MSYYYTLLKKFSFIRSQNYENFLVILLRFSLVFVLLLPLVVNSTPFPDTIFPYLMGKALFFRISVEVMFIFWLSLLLINSKYKPKVSILLFVLGLFLFISLLSSLFSVDIDKSFWSTLDRMDGFIDLFHWFVYFLILISINVDWNACIKYFNFQLIVGFVLGIENSSDEEFDLSILFKKKEENRKEVKKTSISGLPKITQLI